MMVLAYCWLIPSAWAEVWFSVSVPNSYQFSGAGNAQFNSATPLSGTPSSDIIFLADFPYLPALGYEKYQIALESDNSDENTAIIDVEFFDIALYFRQKFTSFLIGFGYGSMEMDCKVSSCASLEIEKGVARQVFGQVGVLLAGDLFFHIDAHRVMGENRLTLNSNHSQLTLDGLMFAYGLKIGF